MTILLYIVFAIGGIIGLFLIIAVFSKKGYLIERSVTINKPSQEVFNYIKLLRNQDHYSKWVMRDPNMKKDFRGTDGTEGFVYGWNSTDKKNDAGAGEMEIKRIIDGERVDAEIRFERPMKAVSKAVFVTKNEGTQTKATWSFESTMNFPFNAMLVLMPLEKMLARDMDESLSLLKKNLEN